MDIIKNNFPKPLKCWYSESFAMNKIKNANMKILVWYFVGSLRQVQLRSFYSPKISGVFGSTENERPILFFGCWRLSYLSTAGINGIYRWFSARSRPMLRDSVRWSVSGVQGFPFSWDLPLRFMNYVLFYPASASILCPGYGPDPDW